MAHGPLVFYDITTGSVIPRQIRIKTFHCFKKVPLQTPNTLCNVIRRPGFIDVIHISALCLTACMAVNPSMAENLMSSLLHNDGSVLRQDDCFFSNGFRLSAPDNQG